MVTTDPFKVKTKGLFDPSGAGGQSYQDHISSGAPFSSIAPGQIDDSVANKVNEIAKSDSKLMKMAKTEGMQLANRRGLLNSSHAVGSMQDAVLRYAMPIASQDAAQSAAKNAAARNFEYGMASQDDAQEFQAEQAGLEREHQTGLQGADIASRERINLSQIESTEGLAAAQRALDLQMQQASISAAEQQQIRGIASTEGMAAAERALQEAMQQRSIASAENINLSQIASTEGIAAAERALEDLMQARNITAAEQQQIRDVNSREGIASAERAMQELLQARQISATERFNLAQIQSTEGLAAAERALDVSFQ